MPEGKHTIAVTTRILVLCAASALLGLALFRLRPGVPITISWNSGSQVIDGFGASATGYTGKFSSVQADRYFSDSVGLGLSLLRIHAIAETHSADCDCVANNSPATCIPGSRSQIVEGDLQVAQLAVARGAKLIAAPWSPPAAMKTSGKYCSGGEMVASSANFRNYAASLADFVALLNARGLSLFALSVQNEPDIVNSEYDTCLWKSKQIHDFLPYLASSLQSAGYGDVKIGIPEESGWKFDLMKSVTDDPAVSAHVGLLLGHAYGSGSPPDIPSFGHRHVWQTEVSNSGKFDGGMGDAIGWAKSVHEFMTAGANAWLYWNLDCGPEYFNHDNNMCLTDRKSNLAKRAFVLGNYAKFVRPGWNRIAVENSGSLLVTAYKGANGRFAIVAINANASFSETQTFVLDGFPSSSWKITPWLTSSNASLAPQPVVAIDPGAAKASGTTSISYTIPALSVVTFYGTPD